MARTPKRMSGKSGRTGRKPRPALPAAELLEKLWTLPEGTLSERDQAVLRRLWDIHRKVIPGTITQVDLANLKRLEKKYRRRKPYGP